MRFQWYRKLVMFNLHFSDLELICWVPALCAAQWEQNMPPEQLSCWPTSVNIKTKILLLPYVLHWFIISYQITSSPSCMFMVGRVLLILSNLFLPTMSFLISATRHKPRPAPKERWHKWPATPLTWQIHSCFRGSDQTNHASSVNIDYCSTMMVTAARLLQGISTLLAASEWWFICGSLRFPSHPDLYFKAHHIMSWPSAHASPTQPWLNLAVSESHLRSTFKNKWMQRAVPHHGGRILASMYIYCILSLSLSLCV